jgi:hypothetical protein
MMHLFLDIRRNARIYSFFGWGGNMTGMGGRYIFLANVALVTTSTAAGAADAGCVSGAAVTTTLPPLLTSSFICTTVFCMNEIMPHYTMVQPL